MPQPYSQELRKRMITAVEAGNSRREVARSFNVSPGCVIKLMQQWEATGDCRPYQQKALAEHEAEVRALLVADPDISVTELWCAIKALGIKVSRATVGRFLQYLKLKTKKRTCTPPNNNGQPAVATSQSGNIAPGEAAMRNRAAMLRRLFMCWWGGCGGRIYTGLPTSPQAQQQQQTI